jgi:hypothetical protein
MNNIINLIKNLQNESNINECDKLSIQLNEAISNDKNKTPNNIIMQCNNIIYDHINANHNKHINYYNIIKKYLNDAFKYDKHDLSICDISNLIFSIEIKKESNKIDLNFVTEEERLLDQLIWEELNNRLV